MLAYALGVSLLLGAAALLRGHRADRAAGRHDGRITDDTAMGVAFAGLFPLGVILLAVQEHPTRSLADFLFGDVLANSPSDVRATIVLALLIGAGLWLGYRAALATSFDRGYAAPWATGRRRSTRSLLSLVAATVVVSMMTVGNVLALALLVTPAAGPACWSGGCCRCSAWRRCSERSPASRRSSCPTGPAWPRAPRSCCAPRRVRALPGGRRDARAGG